MRACPGDNTRAYEEAERGCCDRARSTGLSVNRADDEPRRPTEQRSQTLRVLSELRLSGYFVARLPWGQHFFLLCGHGSIHGVRTQDSYAGLHPGTRHHILRLIICACRTVVFGRFPRIRVKNLHTFKSKKSRINLWGVKLQDKVRSIFVRYEIFENIRRTQRIDKGKHKHPFANPLCLTGIFENFVPNMNTSDFML